MSYEADRFESYLDFRFDVPVGVVLRLLAVRRLALAVGDAYRRGRLDSSLVEAMLDAVPSVRLVERAELVGLSWEAGAVSCEVEGCSEAAAYIAWGGYGVDARGRPELYAACEGCATPAGCAWSLDDGDLVAFDPDLEPAER